jgi:L-arabinose isomerase
MEKPLAGLLPLYLKLYDETLPDLRREMEDFLDTIVLEIEKQGITVARGRICTIKEEFKEEIRKISELGACVLVTLHLAYSPSLESAEALASTDLPLIVFDTTPDFEFGPGFSSNRIMNNHGIHGAQDMCNLLLRNNKKFEIVAGHYSVPDVMKQLSSKIKSAYLASDFKNNRIGRIGGPFKGMGDFQVENCSLKEKYGIEIIEASAEEISHYMPAYTDKTVEEEINENKTIFKDGGISKECHANAARASLAVRQWLGKEKLTGFTINFSALSSSSGLITMPFLEADKAMARGIGYAGEGDTITSALNSTLLKIADDSSFAEMFCPDWKNNSIFLSHMGEINLKSAAEKPVLAEKKLPFIKLENPAIAFARFKPGRAQLANLAPAGGGSFNFIVAEIVIEDVKNDSFKNTIRGWFKPCNMDVAGFLKEFSRHGGTHHSVITYGGHKEVIADFGRMMQWNVIEL